MEIARFLLDLLFPLECLGCGKNETFLCGTCASGIALPEALCVFCGVHSAEGKPCLACAKTHSLDRVLVAASYDDQIIRRAVHALKYEGVKDLAKPLGVLMVKRITPHLFPLPQGERREKNKSLSLEGRGLSPVGDVGTSGEGEFVVIPLPLHPTRLKTRGYNQAELLAHEVATAFSLPLYTDMLVRIRATSQQVGLTGDERRENLKNAFSLTPLLSKERLGEVISLHGKTILLIDDVTTTGTTLNEAAKVLKKAGAKQVWGVVVARG